jgi:hypothetical protein
MATATDMPVRSAADQLLSLAATDNPFEKSADDLLPMQLAATQERFADRVQKIKLLQNRAETVGIGKINSLADLVPLLFAHTAYKSYPEDWLFEQKWNRMARWLATVSTHPVAPPAGEIDGLDNWLEQLEEQGHYVSCSSGTTGKCAMLNACMADLSFSGQDLLRAIDQPWTSRCDCKKPGNRPADGRGVQPA